MPDGQMVVPLLDALPALSAPLGRPRRYPEFLVGDGAYGSQDNQEVCRARAIRSLLAEPCREHGSGLGTVRYVVERSLAWFGHNRRLKVCYEKTGEHFQAFHDLAAALLCAQRVRRAG